MFSASEAKMLVMGLAAGAFGIHAAMQGIGTSHYVAPRIVTAQPDFSQGAPDSTHIKLPKCGGACWHHIDILPASKGRKSGSKGSSRSSSRTSSNGRTTTTQSTTRTASKYGTSTTNLTSVSSNGSRVTNSTTVTPTKYGTSTTHRTSTSH